MHRFCAQLSCSSVTTQMIRKLETPGLNASGKLTSDASDNRTNWGLVLLTCSPTHCWPCLLAPGFYQHYTCRKPPPVLAPSSLLPASSLLPPVLARPESEPAWAKAGLEHRRVVLVQDPEVQHPAEMLTVKRSLAAPQEQGYAARALATCLETISEAQRG